MAIYKWKKQSLSSTNKEDTESHNVSMHVSVDMCYKLPHNHQNHTKPYVVHGLIRNYHLHFDPKLGQGKCEIRHIPCVYNSCTDQLDFLWITKKSDDKKPRYQIPQHYLYSNILVELSEWNIITLRNKNTD